ncbi:glycoside hydrolase family 97 N-terminal domain-containing protein [Haloferula sp.]|uniref:glycoside hydrolase family 97 protein n=1 Tax=Haloferula sp. TaxID=2497595 RepID=UPI0032A0AEE1
MFFATCMAHGQWSVESPNQKLKLSVSEQAGKIRYEVSSMDELIVKRSNVGIAYTLGKNQSLGGLKWSIDKDSISKQTIDETWEPVFGKRAVVRNNYNELTITAKSNHDSELSVDVIFRAYDDGVAFRQVVGTGNTAAGKLSNLSIERCLSTINFTKPLDWWSYRREQEPSKRGKTVEYPLFTEMSADRVVVVTEGHLRDMGAMKLNKTKGGLEIISAKNFRLPSLPYTMPWRVVMIGDTAGQLLDSDLIVNLNPKADKSEFDWVKSGVCLWDWRVSGYTTKDGFTYGQNPESWTRLIDFAAETGLPYVMIDANWYGPEHEATSDPINGGQAAEIRKLVKYGEERGVGLILYLNHVGAVREGIDKIMAAYKEWGVQGIKYGFMKLKGAEQTVGVHEVSELAAKYELLINYHDGPLPPTGEEAYMPSMANREFCHAQADSLRSFTVGGFLGMVHVNMMAGPLDMNNGMFDLDAIAAKPRPKVQKPIHVTITGEAARTLIAYGGAWSVLIDSPESYRERADLFRFISAQKMPWVESKTLQSKMHQYISMMRQTGDTFLVGSVTNGKARELEIDLSFLPQGKTYEATIFEDAADAHFMKKRVAYTVRKQEVNSTSKITARMVPGGGHCMIIELQ